MYTINSVHYFPEICTINIEPGYSGDFCIEEGLVKKETHQHSLHRNVPAVGGCSSGSGSSESPGDPQNKFLG